jgi:uncharacterized membrane protein
MQPFVNFIHLLSLVCWIGAVVFFSFFTAPAVFKTLDRPSAGNLISVIFPRYYFLGYVCSGLLLVTYLWGAPVISAWKAGLILVILVATFIAGTVVQPKARNLKLKIKSTASEEDRQSFETQFKRLHSVSVQLNTTVLVAGLVLLWLTAQGLNL